MTQAQIHASYGRKPEECRVCGEVHPGKLNDLCAECDRKAWGRRDAVYRDDGHGCVERVHPNELAFEREYGGE